jgi:hypothetical protein
MRVFKWIFEELVPEGVDYIYMAQKRDKWRTLVQSVIIEVLEINYKLKIYRQ